LNSENCQLYADFVGGGGGQETDEVSMLMGGLRWQQVNYPSSWSPFARVLGGYMRSDIKDRVRHRPLAAAGFGVTRYLHERLDFRVEGRLGVAHKAFSQVTVGLQIKIDKWVDYFASKMKALGRGTVEATGDILHATGDALAKPFKAKEAEKENEKEKATSKEKK
jgi:hypothetical protein